MSSAAVYVDDPIRPWQQAVIAALEGDGVDVRLSATPSPRRRASLAVRLYGSLERWPSSRAAPPPPDEAPSGAEVVVDLTSGGAHAAPGSSVPVLSLHPRELDEEAVLAELAARRRTFHLEVRVQVGASAHRVAASTVGLNRFSARRGAQRISDRAAALIVRARGRVGSADDLEHADPDVGSTPPPARFASVARLLAEAAASRATVALTRVDWRVAYGPAVRGEPFSVPRELTPVAAPPGRFYADPFLVERGGELFLFVEDFDVGLDRAAISVIDLATGEVRRALTADHHLSYPFVFEVDGTWYMLPEQATTGRVTLLRCEEFPHRWVDDTVLVDGVRAYDATLVQHEGRWWLFFAAGTGSSPDDELHVWSSPSLRGPYSAHPANPVVSSVIGSRPAGRIVHADGRLLRPAQDGSGEYGRAIVINEILSLTPTDYAERSLTTLAAHELGAAGIHTINTAGGLVVVDTKHWVLRRPGRPA